MQTIDLKAEEEKRKAKAIRSYEKQIELHQRKINNPKEYVKDWESKSERYKLGLINYWKKEITNFENQINKLVDK